MTSVVCISEMPFLMLIGNAVFVLFLIKTNNDEVPGNEGWRGATIQIIIQDPHILGIGEDIPLLKRNPSRREKGLRLRTRTTPGFRVKQNPHILGFLVTVPVPICSRFVLDEAIGFRPVQTL